MNTVFGSSMVLVPMHEATVALLAGRRLSDDEPLGAVVERLAGLTRLPRGEPEVAPRVAPSAKHRAEVLGDVVGAATLGRLFGTVVDVIDGCAPEVIELLSEKRARTRAFVSREKVGVHPDRPDLRVRRTNSSWWVSANVGEADVRRSLVALCRAAKLQFGKDIRFPVK